MLETLQSFIESFGEMAANSYKMPDDKASFDIILTPFIQDFPRQGRNAIIKEFWSRYEKEEDVKFRKPTCMIHGSAGCGKTYLLREIALKRPQDIGRRNVDDVKFIPISYYNSSSSITEIEKNVFKGAFPGSFFAIPRLIHSAFLRNTVDFKTFVTPFLKKFSVDQISSMDIELNQLLKAKFPGKKIVLLIDELSKLDKMNASDETRSYFCSLGDSKDSMVSFCVFSSLSILKLGKEDVFSSASERLIYLLGELSMFTFEESKNIIIDFFDKRGIIFMDNYAMAPESKAKALLEAAMKRIYILSGGHPRTLDTLLSSISKATAAKEYPTISDLLTFILSDGFIEEYCKINHTDYAYVRTVFLAKSVKYSDNIPGLDVTYDAAVKFGQLIGSNDSVYYTPYLPVVNILNWTKVTTKSVGSEHQCIASKLDHMLKIGVKLNPLDFEKFCYLRQEILSHFLKSTSEYKCISLRNLYGNAMMNSKKGNLDIEVDASEVLEIHNYADLSEVTEDMRGIFVPINPRNSGFDYFIRYSTVNNSAIAFIDVYFQVKYSEETSSTKINIEVMDKCLGHCRTASKGKPFVFVMYGWRETTSNLTPHEGSVIYDRSALAFEFGPTLAQFVSTLELSPIRFASSSRSEEERENGEI